MNSKISERENNPIEERKRQAAELLVLMKRGEALAEKERPKLREIFADILRKASSETLPPPSTEKRLVMSVIPLPNFVTSFDEKYAACPVCLDKKIGIAFQCGHSVCNSGCFNGKLGSPCPVCGVSNSLVYTSVYLNL